MTGRTRSEASAVGVGRGAVREADVVVVGGGPAGIGAAIAAARNGASVILVEGTNALGGMATNGLVPRQLDGLLVAGRCISSTRMANGSIRVQPTCMNTGQAAGTAVAMCIQRGTALRDLPGMELRAALAAQGMAL